MPKYLGEIVGEHHTIDELRQMVRKVAESPAQSVLIYGETGTGKGLVARMVHQQSDRSGRPFMDINCAAIPHALLESELFGHERGAFTGAVGKKTGLIEAANGGSVFLDEIREMDLSLQAKLLTLLDSQEFRRIGAVAPTKVDVRFLAATNKILLTEVNEGRFRNDLYYRLQVVAINLPPLRERGEDVLVLTDYFIRRLNVRYDRTISGLDPETRCIFLSYGWPGNVRELENLLERNFILEDDNVIRPHHLPDRILRSVSPPPGRRAEPAPDRGDFHGATGAFQRELIRAALDRAGGSTASAARALGLSRHALRHQMQKLGLLPGRAPLTRAASTARRSPAER
jgi:transcriptional regulator with PAS, ATPase and Fis domain